MRVGRRHTHARRPTAGFTLLTVLVLVATASLAMAVFGPLWAEQAKRARERELLRIGAAYAQGLRSFHAASPGAARQYPQTLAELLMDPRQLGTLRHLRRLYADPINPTQPWGLVRDEAGGIVGVHSQSTDRPIADAPIQGEVAVPRTALTYADWKFFAEVPK